ncbi:transglycosylase SLT domain-containing protein [Phyllobacterium sp. YR531]|uniref:lytic transglycosylase domain-containing protein n=1 Tax=Phyllobacterium sp. YR531 TaxID=1144343 RepID=UPI00026FA137|nr:transglycosylase SLT domain-containing protein [Phyllobacterium sp. YR531]EJN04120.1 soluble lytic murein transglycosylase-like protein [Phyllobacterium sp. YR531]
MKNRFGMICALVGAMALFGSNSAFSKPVDAQPTNLADYLKAKKVESDEKKATEKTAKKASEKSQGKKVSAKASSAKKVSVKTQRSYKKASGSKRPVVQAKARFKTTTVSSRVDTMTTGSVASAAASAGGSTKYSSIITSYASSYGVPIALAHAVVRVESNYRADMTGRAGEVGLMQIKYSTAKGLGYTGSRQALYNPDTNIRWGMKYLAGAHKLGNGTTCGTILRYNAGHGATRMNPISANYCAKVKSQMAAN